MANYTTYINLEKPIATEYYAISVANANNDIIDGQIGAINALLVDGVGAKVYIQDTEPTPALDGDIWFKTSTLTIYFYYAFTDTWVNALAGEKGDTGASVESASRVGDDLVFTLTDATEITLTNAYIDLKGDQGIQGEQGIQGIQGIQGETGLTGASIISAAKSGDDILFTKDDTNTVTLIDAYIDLKGDKGDTGDTGANFTILGTYATLLALQTAHPIGSAGDAWAVGSSDPYLIYIWDTNTLTWTNIGSFTASVSASDVTFTPYGNISAINVQSAIQELDDEKSDVSHLHTGVYEPADSTILKDADIGVTVQEQLVNQTNIKSINGDSILGSGDLDTLTNKTLTTPTISGLMTLNGGQIKFPATQVPSSDANTLDDYEEGTFTPIVYLDGSVAGGTQNCHGTYTKIGRVVHIEVLAQVSSITGTGVYSVGNFPFIISNYTSSYANVCALSRYITFSGYITTEPSPSQNKCVFFDNVSASTTSVIDKARLGTSPAVQFKLTYFTA